MSALFRAISVLASHLCMFFVCLFLYFLFFQLVLRVLLNVLLFVHVIFFVFNFACSCHFILFLCFLCDFVSLPQKTTLLPCQGFATISVPTEFSCDFGQKWSGWTKVEW